MSRYSVFVIPVAHKAAANIAMALVNGDDPAQSNAFSVGANASGNWDDPWTHFYGGMPTTEAWEQQVANLGTAVPQSMSGWPINDLSESDVKAGASHVFLQISVTQGDDPPSPTATLTAALTALGIKRLVEPE